MKKNHNETDCIQFLKKKGVIFKDNGIQMTMIIPSNALGIHSWGRVDFLVNHCGGYRRL